MTGGGLAMAVALAARDGGLPLPAAITVYSPWMDLSCSGETMQTLAQVEVTFSADSMPSAAELYLQGLNPENPQASPLFASNHEILLSDSTRFHEKALAAGTNSTLIRENKLPHVWPLLTYLPEAKKSLGQSAVFMRKMVP